MPSKTMFPEFFESQNESLHDKKLDLREKWQRELCGQMMWARNRAGPVFIRNLSWENSDGCSGDDHHYSHLAIRS